LIDFGAGTGSLALAAARHCQRVVAVDISPAMLARIRAKADAAGSTNIDCVLAGFLNYDHAGPPVDFIYTRNALHHLPDFWKGIALRRLRAILTGGGVLQIRDLVFNFSLRDAKQRIDAWLAASAALSADQGWTRPELEEHLREEFSTFSWLLEPLIRAAGFEVVKVSYDESGAYGDYICRRSG
jgi:SAM-dependent methyltransferase